MRSGRGRAGTVSRETVSGAVAVLGIGLLPLLYQAERKRGRAAWFGVGAAGAVHGLVDDVLHLLSQGDTGINEPARQRRVRGFNVHVLAPG